MLQLQITEDIYGYRNSLDNLSFPMNTIIFSKVTTIF